MSISPNKLGKSKHGMLHMWERHLWEISLDEECSKSKWNKPKIRIGKTANSAFFALTGHQPTKLHTVITSILGALGLTMALGALCIAMFVM